MEPIFVAELLRVDRPANGRIAHRQPKCVMHVTGYEDDLGLIRLSRGDDIRRDDMLPDSIGENHKNIVSRLIELAITLMGIWQDVR